MTLTKPSIHSRFEDVTEQGAPEALPHQQLAIAPLAGSPRLKHNIKVGLLCVLSWLLYVGSVQRCPQDSDWYCMIYFILPHLPIWVASLFISALISTWVLLGSSQSTAPKPPRKFKLIQITVMIYLCYFYSSVLNSKEYGAIISVLYQFLLLVQVTTVLIFRRLKKTSRRIRRTVGLITLTIVLVTLFRLNRACKTWDHGLQGERIDNSESCQVDYPHLCIYEATKGIFNFTKLISLRGFNPDQEIMSKYLPEGNLIAYPRAEHFSRDQRNLWEIQRNVLKKVKVVSDIADPIAEDREIFVNKSILEESQIMIRVVRNETLAEERKNIKSQSLTQNVLVIFFDTVSRAHFHRAMPRTTHWLDSHYNPDKDREHETYQFFKYHATGRFTQYNLMPALYGSMGPLYDPNTVAGQKLHPFSHYYKENGFITGFASDRCQCYDYEPAENFVPGAYDHEGFTFACDPNYLDPENEWSFTRGFNSVGRKGLYGKDAYQYPLEYAEKFFQAYSNDKKLFYLEFMDAHEITGETLRYVDSGLADFLHRMYHQGLMKDTTVLFYSDHGNHNPFIYTLFTQWKIERALPVLFLVLPRKLNLEFGKIVGTYEQSFLTHYQMYHTIMALAIGDEYNNFNQSLFDHGLHELKFEDVVTHDIPCYCNSNQKEL